VTRIIAGAARGRRLSVPRSGTRPTSDRAREAVFSALESKRNSLRGLVVLDLYAGSGALGLEALSRGAKRVDLVESIAAAAAHAQANIDAVGLPGAHLHVMPVERWITSRGATPPADLVFADPPYATDNEHLAAVLASLAIDGMAGDCSVVVERPSRAEAFEFPAGIEPTWERRYGEATLRVGRFGSVTPC